MYEDSVVELTEDEKKIYKDRVNAKTFDLDDMCNRLVRVTEQFSGLPHLYPIQKAIAYRFFEIILSNESISLPISLSRQVGKTELFRSLDAAALIFIPIIAKKFGNKHDPLKKFFNKDFPKNNGIWIGHMSNTEEQAVAVFNGVDDILNTEYAEMVMADEYVNVGKKKVKNKIVITNGSFIQWLSLHPQAKIESKSYKVIQYDEAQDMKDKRYQTDASPMGAAWNAPEFFFGTAGDQPNMFYKLVQEGREHDKRVRGYKKQCFYAPYQEGIKENPYYKTFVENKKKTLGEQSDEFQKSYCLKWLFEAGMALPAEVIEKNKHEELEFGIGSVRRGAELYFGIDFAKTTDKTVLSIFTKHWHLQKDPEIQPPKQLLYLNSWRGTDYDTQFYEICDIIDEFIRESHGMPMKMVLDGTGVGDAISDRFVMKYDFDMEVEVVFYSLPMKSKLAKNFLAEMRAGRVWLPDGSVARRSKEAKEMYTEFESIEKKTRGQYVICSHPDRKGAHDDYFDSMCNGTWAAYLPGMGEAEEIKDDELVTNPFRRHPKGQAVMSGIEYDQFGRRIVKQAKYVYN